MFGPRYMQAVAGTETMGSYYSQLPEQLSYPNQEGSSYLPGFGHVTDYEPLSQDDETMYLTPPELPPNGEEPPPTELVQNGNGMPVELIQRRLTWVGYVWTAASMASSGACAYHGYKRNQSVGWAIAWALVGGLFPVISVGIAAAQGFGKRKVGR